MKTPAQIIDDVLESEGGYVNHPKDKGGPTKYGITIPVLSQHIGRKATIEDIKNLTRQDAEVILENQFYYDPHFDLLCAELQAIMTDTAVLFGPHRSVLFLQEVINQIGKEKVNVDGKLGLKTANAADLTYYQIGQDMINAIANKRIAYHKEKVRKSPAQKVFLAGWINRAESFIS